MSATNMTNANLLNEKERQILIYYKREIYNYIIKIIYLEQNYLSFPPKILDSGFLLLGKKRDSFFENLNKLMLTHNVIIYADKTSNINPALIERIYEKFNAMDLLKAVNDAKLHFKLDSFKHDDPPEVIKDRVNTNLCLIQTHLGLMRRLDEFIISLLETN